MSWRHLISLLFFAPDVIGGGMTRRVARLRNGAGALAYLRYIIIIIFNGRQCQCRRDLDEAAA